MRTYKGECMLWAKALTTKGYGFISYSKNGRQVRQQAHRALYEAEYGELPKELVLDHLCRNKACINLEHLEPVSNRENIMRGVLGELRTHCKQGHEKNETNTWVTPKGHTKCRICHNSWKRANRQKNYFKGKYSKVSSAS